MAATRALPPDLAAAARWLDSWRRRRTARQLPDEAWSRATELSRRHGVSATCRALRVDYYKLERLRRRRGAVPASAAKRPTFVELAPAPPPEYVVEFEDGRGACMRVRVPEAGRSSLDGLTRLFLDRSA